MKLAILSSSDFQNFDEFQDLVEERYKTPPESVITTSLDSMAARYAADRQISTQIIFAETKKHGAKAVFMRDDKVLDEADEILFLYDAESSGTTHAICRAIHKKKRIKIEYFGFPQKVNEKPVTNIADKPWYHDDYPCKILIEQGQFSSISAAMIEIVSKVTTNYKDGEWLKSLDKKHKDRLLKIMYELQCAKFGDFNPVLERKIRLQKGEFKLPEESFWPFWSNKMLNKIREKYNTVNA